MAILISSESLKSFKSLGESLNLLKPQSQSKKKSNLHLKLIEPSKTPSQDSIEASKKIVSWFLNLEISQIKLMLSHCNPIISSILIQIFIHKCNNGNIEISLLSKPQKSFQDFDLKSHFSIRKISGSKTLKSNAEDLIEKNLYLFDTEEYCDSIGLNLDVFGNASEIFKVFCQISNQSFLSMPIKAHFQNFSKKWVFEYPSWLNKNNFFSLAAWAVASFERNIWVNYYKMNKIEPKENFENLEFSFEEVLEPKAETFEDLKGFFKGITESERKEMVWDEVRLRDFFTEVLAKFADFSTQQVPNFCGPMTGSAYLTMNTKNNYQNIKCLDFIFEQLQGVPEKFVEFLFCSPMNRVGSVFDMVLRKIGLDLKENYNKHIVKQLMFEEITKKNAEAKSKFVNKKAKSSKRIQNRKYSKSDKNEETEAKCAVQATVRNLVSKIMTNLYKFIDDSSCEKLPSLMKNHSSPCESISSKVFDSESDFQTVNQRKNKRPQPQQKSSHVSESYKPKYHARGGKNVPKKSKQVVVAKPKKQPSLWESASSHSLVCSNDSEFPPLTASVNAREYLDSLHQEIVRFSNQVIMKVQEKSKYISVIIHRINAIVGDLLGGFIHLFGSYATGFAIENSDIDLAVIGVEFGSRQALQDACIQLTSSLEILPFVVSCKPIVTAKIPVIKLQADLQFFTGVPNLEMIDITFVDSAEGLHLGIEAISFTKDLLILFPHIQYIALVVKHFLYANNLNSAYHGGLSSYSLILWITASLNSMNTVPEDLAEILEYFLDFFGNKFDPKIYGINIVNRGSLFLLPEGCFEHAVTVDPINHENNTTRTSYRIAEVIQEFRIAHGKIKEITSKGKKKPTLKQIFKNFSR